MTDEQNPQEHGDQEEPVVRDKRRFDPVTGEPRSQEGAAPAASSGDDLSEEDRALLDSEAEQVRGERERLETESAERLEELQRLRAEYVNYRNRVERERAADHQASVAGVIKTLLPALDDLALAEQHGDLEGSPLGIVAQKLRGAFAGLDVHTVGEVGEVFDPSRHEAIAQLPSPDATEMTVLDVVQRGYRVGDRLLRAAKVAVQVPAEPPAQEQE